MSFVITSFALKQSPSDCEVYQIIHQVTGIHKNSELAKTKHHKGNPNALTERLKKKHVLSRGPETRENTDKQLSQNGEMHPEIPQKIHRFKDSSRFCWISVTSDGIFILLGFPGVCSHKFGSPHQITTHQDVGAGSESWGHFHPV